jgi:hypothetical protein
MAKGIRAQFFLYEEIRKENVPNNSNTQLSRWHTIPVEYQPGFLWKCNAKFQIPLLIQTRTVMLVELLDGIHKKAIGIIPIWCTIILHSPHSVTIPFLILSCN